MKVGSRRAAEFVCIILPRRWVQREMRECCENRGVVQEMMDHDRQQPSSSLPLALYSPHHATSSPRPTPPLPHLPFTTPFFAIYHTLTPHQISECPPAVPLPHLSLIKYLTTSFPSAITSQFPLFSRSPPVIFATRLSSCHFGI